MSAGKSYTYRYPYSYGKSIIENNEINNPYIQDVPVTIRINGGISTPLVQLLDANGEICSVIPVNNTDRPQHIIINWQTENLVLNGTASRLYARGKSKL